MSFNVNSKDDEDQFLCIKSNDFDFDNIIGTIEDMLVTEEFQEEQNKFLDKHWEEFDDGEENKLVYMEIFQEYQEKIESFIESYLRRTISGFFMSKFISDLEKRKNQLEGEIFEVLCTFTDFVSFKEMVLDYRAMKEGKTIDFSEDIKICNISSCSLTNEDDLQET